MSASDAGWKTWYTEVYLQSEGWKSRRDAVLRRANFVCEGCGERPATQVHHRPEAYRQLRKHGRELLCDLVALCDDCHKFVAHDGTPDKPKALTLREDLHSRILLVTQRMEKLHKAALEAPTIEAGAAIVAEHNSLCDLVMRLEAAWAESPEALTP